jgi:NADH-quinone oxidoreductase subunit N
MTDRLAYLWPEIALFVTTCVVMITGLSRSLSVRNATAWIAGLGVLVSLYLAAVSTPHTGGNAVCPLTGITFAPAVTAQMGQMLIPDMVPFAKCAIAAVGLMLLLLLAGTVDRTEEGAIASGKRAFDPLRANRAEFYAFYLFSLTGLMLTASANDLVWLFLALELTSLPTYIMVAMSTSRNQAREAGVKYFFLGALGAAIFLFGFALIYGGTGETKFNEIATVIATQGINSLTMAGILLSLLGFAFKIAAVPMHFYTADVYQGASSQVSAFLAFVPKTAGFLAILLLCAVVGWHYESGPTSQVGVAGVLKHAPSTTDLPEPVRLLLWVTSALTMTVGNVLAVLQTSIKRTLAYSSIAHSGYMLVGVIAGPFNDMNAGPANFLSLNVSSNGVGAVLFYLLGYGVMNVGAFAALAMIERSPRSDGEAREVDHFDDIRGLCKIHPIAGWTLVLSSLSLLGLPPLLLWQTATVYERHRVERGTAGGDPGHQQRHRRVLLLAHGLLATDRLARCDDRGDQRGSVHGTQDRGPAQCGWRCGARHHGQPRDGTGRQCREGGDRQASTNERVGRHADRSRFARSFGSSVASGRGESGALSGNRPAERVVT